MPPLRLPPGTPQVSLTRHVAWPAAGLPIEPEQIVGRALGRAKRRAGGDFLDRERHLSSDALGKPIRALPTMLSTLDHQDLGRREFPQAIDQASHWVAGINVTRCVDPGAPENLNRHINSILRLVQLPVDIVRQGSQRRGGDDRRDDHRLRVAPVPAGTDFLAQRSAFKPLIGNDENALSPIARRRRGGDGLGRLSTSTLQQQNQSDEPTEAEDEQQFAHEQTASPADDNKESEADSVTQMGLPPTIN